MNAKGQLLCFVGFVLLVATGFWRVADSIDRANVARVEQTDAALTECRAEVDRVTTAIHRVVGLSVNCSPLKGTKGEYDCTIAGVKTLPVIFAGAVQE